MTTPGDLGYAFALSLPPGADARLRAWAEATPGATWDESGSHVTLARLTGSVPPENLIPAFHEACARLKPFQAAFTLPLREPYWDKPGLEIVMLAGETATDIAGVMALRDLLLAATESRGLVLFEPGDYRPHVTLTTGLPSQDALRLETAAGALNLRFTAEEVVYWCGGESPDAQTPAGPPWYVVDRVLL